MINFKNFGKKYVWKTVAVSGVLALLLTAAGLVSAPSADAKGPQFSLDVEAFCGDPNAQRLDEDGNVIEDFPMNVAVVLTDVSDDNGPADPRVDDLTVDCLAAVKKGRGKPTQEVFWTHQIENPEFGLHNFDCPLDLLPEGATEWKATATASGGDLRRSLSDTCEEVLAQ